MSAVADGEERQDFTPVALQWLLNAVKNNFTEQLDELRASLPAKIAEAVWSCSPQSEALQATKPDCTQPALQTYQMGGAFLGSKRTTAPKVAHPSTSNLSVLPEAPTTHDVPTRSESSPMISKWLGDARRQQDWFWSDSAVMHSRHETGNSIPGAPSQVSDRRVRTIGSLKSQIADQLLRQRALLPQQRASHRSKVADESAGSAPGCPEQAQSPDFLPANLQRKQTRFSPGTLCAVDDSGNSSGGCCIWHAGSPLGGAGALPDSKPQDPRRQVRSHSATYCMEVAGPASSTTPDDDEERDPRRQMEDGFASFGESVYPSQASTCLSQATASNDEGQNSVGPLAIELATRGEAHDTRGNMVQNQHGQVTADLDSVGDSGEAVDPAHSMTPDEPKDLKGQMESDFDPSRSVTPSIKALVSTLDPWADSNLNQLKELRLRRVTELTSCISNRTNTGSSDDSESLRDSQPSGHSLQYHAMVSLPGQWLLLAFGILPPQLVPPISPRRRCYGSVARCYQPLVCLVCALACFEVITSSLRLDVGWRGQDIEKDGLQLGPLSDLALAISSLAGLLLLGAPLGSRALRECFPLLFLTGGRTSHLRLTNRMWRELVGQMLIWLAALLCRLYVDVLPSDSEHDLGSALHSLAFALISGVLISLALTMLSVCHSLAIMIDTFCVKASEILTCSGDLTVAVREWNVVQAVLRKASRTIEHCFFALQTGALAAAILAFFDVTQGLVIEVIPTALVLLGLTRIFYCAAAITDKCADVPSLINSLHFGEDLDTNRQYVVQYIMQSAAGFYVFGVPLNSAMTLKLAYFSVVATLGLMHRLLSTGW